MRFERSGATAALLASLLPVWLAPNIDATPTRAEMAPVSGLTLRPAQPGPTEDDVITTAVDEQAYVLGPVFNTSRCLEADADTINANGTTVHWWTCDPTSAPRHDKSGK